MNFASFFFFFSFFFLAMIRLAKEGRKEGSRQVSKPEGTSGLFRRHRLPYLAGSSDGIAMYATRYIRK